MGGYHTGMADPLRFPSPYEFNETMPPGMQIVTTGHTGPLMPVESYELMPDGSCRKVIIGWM